MYLKSIYFTKSQKDILKVTPPPPTSCSAREAVLISLCLLCISPPTPHPSLAPARLAFPEPQPHSEPCPCPSLCLPFPLPGSCAAGSFQPLRSWLRCPLSRETAPATCPGPSRCCPRERAPGCSPVGSCPGGWPRRVVGLHRGSLCETRPWNQGRGVGGHLAPSTGGAGKRQQESL